ncbi:MAG: hypothetical protein ACR2NN_27090 [Bryobacteraceae bacterium]
MKAERKEKLKADQAAGVEEPDMEDVPLSGPIPLEFDPDLDRGLTPDLEAELDVANRTASRTSG